MNDVATAKLSAENLCIRVPGRRLLDELSFTLEAGEILAVLGRNGSGKTLMLHTLAGLRDADGGTVSIDGMPIDAVERRRLARRLALLPQTADDVFPVSVLETVIIGRYPHSPPLAVESSEDLRIARQALARVDLDGLEQRNVLTLSGGERRRLAIAQLLAQQAQVCLLDEPGNHLDPEHQLDVMRLFRRHADDGAAVMVSLHDLNVAARFADRCLLLFGDGRWALGPREEILTEARLSELYGTTICAVDSARGRLFVAAGLFGEAS